MNIDTVSDPLTVDVVSAGTYSPTFAEVRASLYTTNAEISLISTDSTTLLSATFYLRIDDDPAGLLCPNASPTTPCQRVLYSNVPIYNASIGYQSGGMAFVQVIPASLKALYLSRLATTNDSISGKMFIQLHGRNERGETIDSNFFSTNILIRDFPG